MADLRAGADFSFVHAADLHLDAPCKGLSETAPHVASALRDASLEAFDSLIQLCLEREAAFLVLAGDIYDGAERGLRAQLRFREGLQRLSDAGIRTFVVHGNHDPVEEGWSAVERWPELVHFFGPDEVAAVEVVREGRILATVQGISYARREVTENLAKGFREKAGGGFQVGLLHCNVAGAADGYAAYSPCTLEELRQIGLDYWALGHIHSTMVLSGVPGGTQPWVVYPGNLQARSRKPSEQGRKGAMVVEVRSGRVQSADLVPCDSVRFATVEIDTSPVRSLAELTTGLERQAALLLEQSEGRSLVLRGRLSGRGELHGELRRPGVLEELHAALRAEGGTTTPFVWWDRLEDATLPLLDLDSLRGGEDFTGNLLSLAGELAGRELADDFELELLGKMPLELRRIAREMLGELGQAFLLEKAALLALDELEVGP